LPQHQGGSSCGMPQAMVAASAPKDRVQHGCRGGAVYSMFSQRVASSVLPSAVGSCHRTPPPDIQRGSLAKRGSSGSGMATNGPHMASSVLPFANGSHQWTPPPEVQRGSLANRGSSVSSMAMNGVQSCVAQAFGGQARQELQLVGQGDVVSSGLPGDPVPKGLHISSGVQPLPGQADEEQQDEPEDGDSVCSGSSEEDGAQATSSAAVGSSGTTEKHVPSLRGQALIAQVHEETGFPTQKLLRLYRKGLLQRVPLDEDGRFTSVGAIKHAAGQCRPCLFWFRGSCGRSVQCSFCHIVHEGQTDKRVRPSKRQRERAARIAGTQEGNAQ